MSVSKEELNEELKLKNKKKMLLIILITLIFLFFIVIYFLGYKLGKIDIVPAFIETNDNYYDDDKNKTIENNILEKPKETKDSNINIATSNLDKKQNETDENIIEETYIPKKEEVKEQKVDVLEITEDDLNWNVQGNLNIFSNPQFNHKLMIAPGSGHYYQFIVENKTGNPIKYNMIFTDTNQNQINLKYKLKLDNSYIMGKENWVDVSGLDLNDIVLAGNSKNLYMIEWKWIEGTEEQDTLLAGKSYELFINVTITENL